jgi:hypothetical protein
MNKIFFRTSFLMGILQQKRPKGKNFYWTCELVFSSCQICHNSLFYLFCANIGQLFGVRKKWQAPISNPAKLADLCQFR